MSRQPKQTQAVHWVILIIVTLLTILVIVVPIILFILTKNVYTFVPIAGLLPLGYAWKRILDYFLPKGPRDYEMEKEKIQAMVQIHQHKKA